MEQVSLRRSNHVLTGLRRGTNSPSHGCHPRRPTGCPFSERASRKERRSGSTTWRLSGLQYANHWRYAYRYQATVRYCTVRVLVEIYLLSVPHLIDQVGQPSFAGHYNRQLQRPKLQDPNLTRYKIDIIQIAGGHLIHTYRLWSWLTPRQLGGSSEVGVPVNISDGPLLRSPSPLPTPPLTLLPSHHLKRFRDLNVVSSRSGLSFA